MFTNFLNELKLSLPNLYIITADAQKSSYETDWRKKFTTQCITVVFPTLVTEIQQVIFICKKHKITITPQGGNTSTCGGSVPSLGIKNSIILNLSKMNKIIEYDKNNSSLVVESGCTLSQVQQFALYNNYYFPLTIASEETCQIGGNVATNAGGVNVI
ncbi:MAG: FAD-binding oxidoreductase, partial [Burkholderiales bacterium]|nr:FAD-binding oxidoreductase [Burkholderiales bacterium]